MKRSVKSLFVMLVLVAIVSTTLVACSAGTQSQDPNWQRGTSFKGNSDKKTNTFHITSEEWRIKWSAESEDTTIYVYNSDGTLMDMITSVFGDEEGVVNYVYSGDYYLTIKASGPYTVTVEQKKQ